jgi:hypothetical protein
MLFDQQKANSYLLVEEGQSSGDDQVEFENRKKVVINSDRTHHVVVKQLRNSMEETADNTAGMNTSKPTPSRKGKDMFSISSVSKNG